MIEYQPYDDKTQLARQIDRYPRSFTRNPKEPLVERPLTRSERTGPAAGQGLRYGTRLDLTSGRPIGQMISVTGRVTDEDGSPLAGALIELWQANASGKYIHQLDRFDAPLDPNFTGQGRFVTDAEGRFELITVKPGAYPVMESDWWWRPPHIHFSIFGPSWMNRYVTQIFFPGDPLNETDLLLNGVHDREARERLIFKPADPLVDRRKALGYQLDFVLRGKRATPAVDR